LTFVFSPDGNSIATRDLFYVRIFDVATGLELVKIESDRRGEDGDETYYSNHCFPGCVCFSPDSSNIIIAHLDFQSGAFGVFCVANGRQILKVTPALGSRYHLYSARFSPDGTVIALGCDGWDGYCLKCVRFYDAVTGHESLRKIKLDLTGDVGSDLENRCSSFSVNFSPDGRKLVIVGHGFRDDPEECYAPCSVYDIATRRKILDGRGGEFCFSLDGQSIALYQKKAQSIVLHKKELTAIGVFDAATGSEIARTIEHKSLSICFSADGKHIISNIGDFRVRMFDVHSGREVLTFYPNPVQNYLNQRYLNTFDATLVARFLPDGRLLVCRSCYDLKYLNSLYIFDAASHHIEGDFEVGVEHEEEMRVAWADTESPQEDRPQFKIFNSSDRSTLDVPDEDDAGPDRVLESGLHEQPPWILKKVMVFPQKKREICRVDCMCFSPDSKFIFSGEHSQARWRYRRKDPRSANHGVLRKFDVSTGKQVLKLVIRGARGVSCMSFSFDGQFLALGCRDGIARIFDSNLRLFREIPHSGPISWCCFSHVDQMLISVVVAEAWNGNSGNRFAPEFSHKSTRR
jgi:WD40 repeat protein